MNYYKINTYAEAMVDSYLECAAWSTSGTDLEGNELESFEGYEFSEDSKRIAALDCLYFVRLSHPWLDTINEIISPESAAHDLWLTRNGHGAGFWGRGYKYGDILSAQAKRMGESDLYLSDELKIEMT